MTRRPLVLTRHFLRRWTERVGGVEPTAEEIARIIAESVKVQHGCVLYTAAKVERRILACYWNAAWGVVLKVDHPRNRVVTVLTPELGLKGCMA